MKETDSLSGRWNAVEYFRNLTESNRLAQSEGFRFCVVSGLQGFQDAVNEMTEASAFVCISDTSDGFLGLHSTPHIRQVKTVFLAMRHDIQSADWPQHREECLSVMRELFRQFMSRFIKERTFVEQGGLIVEPEIQFSEIDRYFLSGCACAYFQIAVTQYSNLIYRQEEWQQIP